MTIALVPLEGQLDQTRLFTNPRHRHWAEWGPRQDDILDRDGFAYAEAVIRQWPGYAATPLRELLTEAKRLGVHRLWYKDESTRFGLGSFKALGGPYAIAQLILRRAARRAWSVPVSSASLFAGHYRDLAQHITVTCASEGNHGRAVAWGAKLFGCKAVVFLHTGVSDRRAGAIEALGAQVRRVEGTYDDAVREAALAAETQGWIVISGTSYPGYTDIPKDVMQGYGLMVAEAIGQLPPDEMPSHVFVQGGVGGLAAAVAAHLTWRWGRRRPRVIIVEPDRAACLFESAKAGGRTALGNTMDTVMAGLASGAPSLIAWDIIDEAVEAFMTVPDHAAGTAMRLLAQRDPSIVAGESGVAGLAGAITACEVEPLRERLTMDGSSRILVFGTEGATDPEIYHRIVGCTPQAIDA